MILDNKDIYKIEDKITNYVKGELFEISDLYGIKLTKYSKYSDFNLILNDLKIKFYLDIKNAENSFDDIIDLVDTYNKISYDIDRVQKRVNQFMNILK
jgi:hypothetical protein